MNLFQHFQAEVTRQIEAMVAEGDLPEGLDASRISVEPPRDSSHGDVTTNAAMVLAKPAGMKPPFLRVTSTACTKGIARVKAGVGSWSMRMKELRVVSRRSL